MNHVKIRPLGAHKIYSRFKLNFFLIYTLKAYIRTLYYIFKFLDWVKFFSLILILKKSG